MSGPVAIDRPPRLGGRKAAIADGARGVGLALAARPAGPGGGRLGATGATGAR